MTCIPGYTKGSDKYSPVNNFSKTTGNFSVSSSYTRVVNLFGKLCYGVAKLFQDGSTFTFQDGQVYLFND